jgi:hypothetical protein
MTCPNCSAPLASDARFCPLCGQAQIDGNLSTVRVDGQYIDRSTRRVAEGNTAANTPTVVVQRGAEPPLPQAPPTVSAGHWRFVPGTVLADRFRIIALLGRGGMGEVFRADDMKLGQPIALKFLPHGVGADKSKLDRLMGEVRVARQIAHPNVCRVYDIGEVGGEHFISMEFIDGEDLWSLLQRIGRLPPIKALQIARQIASGVAAAHERGIVHRDLKPANIMIDERGTARITDFGLASVIDDLDVAKTIEGTPAYMAPEQFSGQPASKQSDIYSLGLVLYELFTGTRAFDAETFAALLEQRHNSTPIAPSTVAPDIDPAVERVILSCLDNDPRNRPKTAGVVAAALPGGDPLAMAVALGETPSPEILAAAGRTAGMRPGRAIACLVAIALSILAVAAAKDLGGVEGRLPTPRSPEQLVGHAREIAARLGYPEHQYSAHGFATDDAFIEEIRSHDKSAHRWARLSNAHPSGVDFWYRESPRPLVPLNPAGRVEPNDPPADAAGMLTIWLESDGSLSSFDAIPSQLGAPAKGVDWAPVLEYAGLRDLQTTAPQWAPATWADSRAAWTGKSSRAEAAGANGRVTWFRVVYPWMKPASDTTAALPMRERVRTLMTFGILAMIIVVAVILARRNVARGRGDRRGAMRVAIAVVIMRFAVFILTADHVLAQQEIMMAMRAFASSLLLGLFVGLLYLGIEPYARSKWPQTLISWNRVLLGKFSDASVGRDVLIGITTGAVLAAFAAAAGALDHSDPPSIDANFLLGARTSLGEVVNLASLTLLTAISIYIVLFVLRVITRRDWIAGLIFVAMSAVPTGLLFSESHILAGLGSAIVNLVALVLLQRFGLVVVVMWNFTILLLINAPLTLAIDRWYASGGILVAVVILALAFYAFRSTLGGKALLSEALLER